MQLDVSTLKAIFNPKLRPLIGLDISSSSIKMVELVDAGKGQPRVERYAIEPLPKDAVVDGNIANLEVVTDTIDKCLKRLGSKTKFVAMALPSAAVITKKITLPAGLRETDMEVQVESEANQYIPFALEEVNLDFQVIGPSPASPDDVDVLLAVESYATQAAYELIVAQLPAGAKEQIITLADIGGAAIKFTMMKGDELLYSREQAFGGGQLTQEIMRAYGVSADEAEAMKRAPATQENYETELLQPFLENLAQEVARAHQFFFTSTPHSEINHIILAGGSALVPGIAEVVARRTGVNTILANPFGGMAVSPRLRAKQLVSDAPSLLVACGLAMRKFDQ